MSDEKKTLFSLIPHFVRHDFLRKLIALFFAVLIWQRVDSEISESESFNNIPVQVSLPPSVDRLDTSPLYVNVKLKGSRRILNKISIADIVVNARIAEPSVQKSPMVVMHRIDPARDITVPRGISVAQVKPEIISLNVDNRISRVVPVKLMHSGMLLEGYSFRVANIIPATVTITGPEGIVKFTNDVKTEPLVFREENIEDFEVDLGLVQRDNISVSRQSVTAHVEVFRRFDLKEFPSVPVKVLGSPGKPARMRLEPASVLVAVDGLRRSVEVLQERGLNAYIDISGLDVPGKYTLKVNCWVESPDLKIKMIKPETIEVVLEHP